MRKIFIALISMFVMLGCATTAKTKKSFDIESSVIVNSTTEDVPGIYTPNTDTYIISKNVSNLPSFDLNNIAYQMDHSFESLSLEITGLRTWFVVGGKVDDRTTIPIKGSNNKAYGFVFRSPSEEHKVQVFFSHYKRIFEETRPGDTVYALCWNYSFEDAQYAQVYDIHFYGKALNFYCVPLQSSN